MEEHIKTAAAPDVPQADKTIEKRLAIERRRVRLMESVSAARLTTQEQRVAWILNNYPKARDSDITLQILYWEQFAEFVGPDLTVNDLYELPRLTTLVRARAKIQNELTLFQASPEVRAVRGTMSEEEKQNIIEAAVPYPVFHVYADESGKNQDNLVVGTLWVLEGQETLRVPYVLRQWKHANGIKSELHFKDINNSNVDMYKAFMAVVIANASALSFKYLSVEKAGVKNVQEAVATLLYHVIALGIRHEHDSGRAPLPRSLQVWKDAEEPGYDKTVLLDLRDRLQNAAQGQFAGQLRVDELEAVPSKGNDLIQVADLFAGAVSRRMNAPADGPKDDFAIWLLAEVNHDINSAPEQLDDFAYRVGV